MIKIYHVLKIYQEPLKRRLFVTHLYQAFRYFIFNQPVLQQIKFIWKDNQQVNRGKCRLSVPSKYFLTEVPMTLHFIRTFSNRNGKTKLSKHNALVRVSFDKYHLMTISTKKKIKPDEILVCKGKRINTDTKKVTKADSQTKIIDLFYGNKNKININRLKQQGRNVYETLLNKLSLSNISTEKTPKKMNSINSPLKKLKGKQEVISNTLSKMEKSTEQKAADNRASDVLSSQESTKASTNKIINEKQEDTKALAVINIQNKTNERDDRSQRKRIIEKTNSFVLSKENNNIMKAAKAKLFKKYQPELDYRLKKLAEKYSKSGMAKAIKHFQKEHGKIPMKKPLKKDKCNEIGLKQKVLKRELKKKLEMDVVKPIRQTNAYIMPETKPKPLVSNNSQALDRDAPYPTKKAARSERAILTIDLKGSIEHKSQKNNLSNVAVVAMPTIHLTSPSMNFGTKPKNENQDKPLSPVILDYKADPLIKVIDNSGADIDSEKKYTPEVDKKTLVLNIVGRKYEQISMSEVMKIQPKKEETSLKNNRQYVSPSECKITAITRKEVDVLKLGQQNTVDLPIVNDSVITNDNGQDMNGLGSKLQTLINNANEVDKSTELKANLKERIAKNEIIGDQNQDIQERRLENKSDALLEENVDQYVRKLLTDGEKLFLTTETNASQLHASKQANNPESENSIMQIIDEQKIIKTQNDSKLIINLKKKSLPENTMNQFKKVNDNPQMELATDKIPQRQNLNINELQTKSSSSTEPNEIKSDPKFMKLHTKQPENKTTGNSPKVAEMSVNLDLTAKNKCIQGNNLHNQSHINEKPDILTQKKKFNIIKSKTPATSLQIPNKINSDTKFINPDKNLSGNTTKNLKISKANIGKASYSRSLTEQNIPAKSEKWLAVIGADELKSNNKVKESLIEKSKYLTKEQISPLTSSNRDYFSKFQASNEGSKKHQSPNRLSLRNTLEKLNNTKYEEKDLKMKPSSSGRNGMGLISKSNNVISKLANTKSGYTKEESIKKERVESDVKVKPSEIAFKLEDLKKPLCVSTLKLDDEPKIPTGNDKNIVRQHFSVGKSYKVLKDSSIPGFLLPFTSGTLEKIENKVTSVTYSKNFQVENMSELRQIKNEILSLSSGTMLLQAANKILVVLTADQLNTSEQTIIKKFKLMRNIDIHKIVMINPQLFFDYFPQDTLGNADTYTKFKNKYIFMLIETRDSTHKVRLFDGLRNICNYSPPTEHTSVPINGDNSEIAMKKVCSLLNDKNDFYSRGNIFLMHGFNKVSLHKVQESLKKISAKTSETKELLKETNKKNNQNEILCNRKAGEETSSNMKELCNSEAKLQADTLNNTQNCEKAIAKNNPNEAENSSQPANFKLKGVDEKMLKSPNIINFKNMSSYTKFTQASLEGGKLLNSMKLAALHEGSLNPDINKFHETKKGVNDKGRHTFSELISHLKIRKANMSHSASYKSPTNKSNRLAKSIKAKEFYLEVQKIRYKNHGISYDLKEIPPRSTSHESTETANSLLYGKYLKEHFSPLRQECSSGNQNEVEIIPYVPNNNSMVSLNGANNHFFSASGANEENSITNSSKKDKSIINQGLNEMGKHGLLSHNSKLEEDEVTKYMNKFKSKSVVSRKIDTGNSVSGISQDNSNKGYRKTNNFLNDNHLMKESSNVGLKTEKWRAKSPTRVLTSFEYSSEATTNKKTNNEGGFEKNEIDLSCIKNDKFPPHNIVNKTGNTENNFESDPPVSVNQNYKIGSNAHELEIKASTKEDKGDTSIQLNIKYLVNKEKSSIGHQSDSSNTEQTKDYSPQNIEKLKPPALNIYNIVKHKHTGNFKELTTYIKQKNKIAKIYDIVSDTKTDSFEELINIVKRNSESKIPMVSHQNLNNTPETKALLKNYQNGQIEERENKIDAPQTIQKEDDIFKEERQSKLELKEVPTSMVLFLDSKDTFNSEKRKSCISKPTMQYNDNKFANIKEAKTGHTDGINSKEKSSPPEDIAKRVEEILAKKHGAKTAKQSISKNIAIVEAKEVSGQLKPHIKNETKKNNSELSKEVASSSHENHSSPFKNPCSDKCYGIKENQGSVLDSLLPTYPPLALPKIFTPPREQIDSFDSKRQDETGKDLAKQVMSDLNSMLHNDKSLQKQTIPNEISEEPKPEITAIKTENSTKDTTTKVHPDFKALTQIVKEINNKELNNPTKNTSLAEKLGLTQDINKKHNNYKGLTSLRDNVEINLNVMDTKRNENQKSPDFGLQNNQQSDINTDKVPSPSRFIKDRAERENEEGQTVSCNFNFTEFSNHTKSLTDEMKNEFSKKRETKLDNKTKHSVLNNNKQICCGSDTEIKTKIVPYKQVKSLKHNLFTLRDRINNQKPRDSHQSETNKMFLDSQSISGVIKQINSAMGSAGEIFEKESKRYNSFFKDEEILQKGNVNNNSVKNENWKKPLTPYRMEKKCKMIHYVTNQIKKEPIKETASKQKAVRKVNTTSLLAKIGKNSQNRKTGKLDRCGGSLQSQSETIINNKVECVSMQSLGLSNKCENEGFISQSVRSESTTDPSSLLFNGKLLTNKKKEVSPEAIKFKITKYRHNKHEEKDSRLRDTEIRRKGMITGPIIARCRTSPSLKTTHTESLSQKSHLNRKKIGPSIKPRSRVRQNIPVFTEYKEAPRKKKLPVSHFACTTPSTSIHTAKVEAIKLKRKHSLQSQRIFDNYSSQKNTLSVMENEANNGSCSCLVPSRSENLTDLLPHEERSPLYSEKEKPKTAKENNYEGQVSHSILFEDPPTKQYMPLLKTERCIRVFEDPEMIQNKECTHNSTKLLTQERLNVPDINDESNQIQSERGKKEELGRKEEESKSLMGSVVTNFKTKLQGIPSSMSKLMAHTQSQKSWLDLSDMVKSKMLEDFTLSNFQKKLKNFHVGMMEHKRKGTQYFILRNLKDNRNENKITNTLKMPANNQANTSTSSQKEGESNSDLTTLNIEKNKIKKCRKPKAAKLRKSPNIKEIVFADDMLKIDPNKNAIDDKKKTSPHLAYSDLLNKLYVKYMNSQTKEIGFTEKMV